MAALGLRIIHAAITDPRLSPRGDNTFFVETARSVASGQWGRLPTIDGSSGLSVKFPPLWPWTLGLGQRLLWFLPSDTANATWAVLIGATVAPLAGLLAWRLLDRLPAGRRCGVAVGIALVAAVHPLLIGATNSLLSEVIVVPISLGIALSLNRIQRCGSRVGSLFGLGALTALATLARPEALLLWGAAIVVVGFMVRSWSAVVLPLAIAVLPALAFSAAASGATDTPVFVSTNAASAVAGANCSATWSGEAIGHWSKDCLDEVWLGRIPRRQRSVIYAHERQPTDRFPLQLGARLEGQIQDAHRRGAVYAIRREPSGFVRAVPFRVARGVGLWWSKDQTRLETTEGRSAPWELAGRWTHLLVVLPAFALAAVGTLRRRGALAAMLDRVADRRSLLPLGIALGVWLLGVVVTHGSTRHRSAVDGVFLMGAALGFAMVLTSRWPGTTSEAPTEPSGAESGTIHGSSATE
ncbi:MAG: hypothetical protein H0U29_02920 [Acidimicrobiia bacterium]|nr:hypothetical protein [Acidimicrobiia bacterium]